MAKPRRRASESKAQEAAGRLHVLTRLRAAGSFLAGTAVWMTGCSTDGNVAGGDPLLGPAAARPAAQAPAATPPVAGAQTAAPLPRQAAPAALTSNAALANGVPSLPDTGQDLRIAGSYPRPDAATITQTGAVLQPPQPASSATTAQLTSAPVASGSVAQTTSAPSTPASASLSSAPTFEQALAALNAHRVSWQRLETLDSGGWKFSCSLPSPQNPGVSRTYTATAAEPVSALRAVLEQLERGQ